MSRSESNLTHPPPNTSIALRLFLKDRMRRREGTWTTHREKSNMSGVHHHTPRMQQGYKSPTMLLHATGTSDFDSLYLHEQAAMSLQSSKSLTDRWLVFRIGLRYGRNTYLPLGKGNLFQDHSYRQLPRRPGKGSCKAFISALV